MTTTSRLDRGRTVTLRAADPPTAASTGRSCYLTFEAYCETRWSITPQHAGRLIVASQVAAALEPIGSTPATESQARELAPLLDQPEALREAWQQVNATTSGKPTAAAIRSIVRPATQPPAGAYATSPARRAAATMPARSPVPSLRAAPARWLLTVLSVRPSA